MKHIPIPPLRALRRLTVAAVLCALSMAAPLAHPASAQERSGNFLENLFNRGEPPAPQQGAQPQGQVAQGQGQGMASDPSDPGVRIDRLEGALRQLTGTVEQLQYRNQQLEMQLKRMQDDTEFRLQQLGSKGPPSNAQPTAPNVPGAPVPAGRRSDVFDPSQNPNAPGAPRTLGNASAPIDQPVGVPGGRAAGAPLDLHTLSVNPPSVPAASAPAAPISTANPVTAMPMPAASRNTQQLAPPPPQQRATPAVANAPQATLPPSARPQDEYDLAYGYVLHKDYGQAERAFREFLRKYPDQRLVPDAHYWLGETLYQRQQYRDAAEAFLAVSTKYEKAGKAPNSLLRLGQSLAALKQKEAACATLNEVGRKYPKAASSVKRSVAAEIKRAHC